METNENQWKSIEIYKINESLMKIVGNLGKLMKIQGNRGKSIEIHENPWKSMNINGNN